MVFIELFRCGDADNLIEVAILRDFSAAQAHSRILVQNIPSHVLHVPLCLLRIMLHPIFYTIVVEFCEIRPKEMTKTQLKQMR